MARGPDLQRDLALLHARLGHVPDGRERAYVLWEIGYVLLAAGELEAAQAVKAEADEIILDGLLRATDP